MTAEGSRPMGRREFLGDGLAAVATLSLAEQLSAVEAKDGDKSPPNILLIISDQESYHLRRPKDYDLPARAELRRRGTAFERHIIAAAMCTPSRGVLFSGQPPQVNGLFDQMENGYVPSLSRDKPNLGGCLKSLGYTTAYFGKFELYRDIMHPTAKVNYQDALVGYGFDEFAPDGDKVGDPDQGYQTDNYTVAEGCRWLRTRARELNRKGKPWFLVISLVSPHDIMYADTNLRGEAVQESAVKFPLTAPPANALYEKKWDVTLSPSRLQPVDAPGRPAAQMEYLLGWSYWLGDIPAKRADMWQLFYNYYLNLISDNDRLLQSLLETLTSLDLWKNTVVIQTADHGELAGSHGGLRGKGPFPFKEQIHVPLVIVHPDHPGGRTCRAVTSHIDFLPTMVGLTGRPADACAALTRGMPGRDLMPLLDKPEAAAADALREGALFNYVGLYTIDADYLKKTATLKAEGKPVPPLSDLHPKLSKRGFLAFATDGRYKLARYYAPDHFNAPKTLDELLRWNDVELFDLEQDPDEMTNLAVMPEKNKETLLRLNELLNKLMAREVGDNNGQFLPAAVRPKK